MVRSTNDAQPQRSPTLDQDDVLHDDGVHLVVRHPSHRRLRERRLGHGLRGDPRLGRGHRESRHEVLDGVVRVVGLDQLHLGVVCCTFAGEGDGFLHGRAGRRDVREGPGAREGAVRQSLLAGHAGHARELGVRGRGGVGPGAAGGRGDGVLAGLAGPHVGGPVRHVAARAVQARVRLGEAEQLGRLGLGRRVRLLIGQRAQRRLTEEVVL